ncbi:SusC/RagA family TonB-linked outer membrane protein [Flavihumibacter stibioxidans]|uniref:SusC/RagA family TonB-linked outer membrane protein n=1 Tax=Flavihumibacter stibioxidans TaxID=1834163 RepID=A0ABR7M934_9BACT|nr:SusC/RagA family TonB-linked outer membrane protein [Flavihumibacter stibioxidans]MBC6491517.1 SusC/RagA family TonB-linked outer membrane protein [Flavihumibacter stibioxidans]
MKKRLSCKGRNARWFPLLVLFQLLSVAVLAQVRISGKVSSAAGELLPSISVQVVNTSFGTSTNTEGKYAFEADLKNGSYTVLFSGVGFKPVEKKISVGTERSFSFDIQLQPDVLGLNEVIVTGTNVATSKKKLGNTVATVSARDIQFSAATGIDGALQGKVAGAQITQNSGNPAGGISVRLRGPSTIVGSSDPLYIVDGVIVNNDSRQLIDLGGYAQNRLVDINPNDIERIEVIKGAAAAAIYGSRANNGVVQIFTKKGKTGAPQVSFSTQLKTNSVRKTLDYNEYPFRFNNNVATDLTQSPVTRYDYQDKIFRTGFGTDNNLSVSGGTEATKYYVGLSNTYNEGIVDQTSFSRNGIRLNVSQKLNKIMTLTAGANYALSSSKEIPNGGLVEAYGALTGFIFSNNFINPEKDPVSGIYPSTAPIAILRRTNPLEAINRFDFAQRVSRFTGNTQLNIKPITGLNIDFIFGLDNYTQTSTAYIPPKNTTPSYDGGLSRRGDASVLQTNTDLNISYRKNVTDWLESTTGLGGTMQYDRTYLFSASAQQLGAFGETINNGTIVAGELREERSIMGAFLQQTFGLYNKLYITGAARVDASSVYGIDNRWQFFPKVSGSYILSEEKFWQDSRLSDIISSFKLRAAWGQSGNLTAIGVNDRYTVYTPGAYQGITGYYPSTRLGNINVKPERQIELELGADMSFFNDRLSLEFTYFNKDVKDLILDRTLAPSTGYNVRYLNVGTMTNKGFEFMIKAVPVERKNFSWVSTISYLNNENTVDGVEGSGVLPFAGGFGQVAAVNGSPLGAFYSTFFARNADGSLLLTPQGFPQRERGVQGKNGNSTIGRDANGQPTGAILSKVIGNPNPKHVFSFINDFNYKKFNFKMQWDGMVGFDVFNFTRRVGDNANYGGLKGYEAELKGEVPKGTSAALFSIFENWIEKGDFVKLRELSVSYLLTPRMGKLRDVRFTLSGRNLLSIDNYSGYDPEVNAAGQSNAVRGFDFVEVPLPRTILVGVNVNF